MPASFLFIYTLGLQPALRSYMRSLWWDSESTRRIPIAAAVLTPAHHRALLSATVVSCPAWPRAPNSSFGRRNGAHHASTAANMTFGINIARCYQPGQGSQPTAWGMPAYLISKGRPSAFSSSALLPFCNSPHISRSVTFGLSQP